MQARIVREAGLRLDEGLDDAMGLEAAAAGIVEGEGVWNGWWVGEGGWSPRFGIPTRLSPDWWNACLLGRQDGRIVWPSGGCSWRRTIV